MIIVCERRCNSLGEKRKWKSFFSLSLHQLSRSPLSLPERRPQRRGRIRRRFRGFHAQDGVSVVGRPRARTCREQARASGVVSAAHAERLAADVRREEEVARLVLLLLLLRRVFVWVFISCVRKKGERKRSKRERGKKNPKPPKKKKKKKDSLPRHQPARQRTPPSPFRTRPAAKPPSPATRSAPATGGVARCSTPRRSRRRAPPSPRRWRRGAGRRRPRPETRP